MKIAYSRRNADDSSNDRGLCSTMIEFNELNLTYPIEVMRKAKNGGSVRKYLVDVNGNASPACEFIATALCRCLSSTAFLGSVNLRKWPRVDFYYFRGDHF